MRQGGRFNKCILAVRVGIRNSLDHGLTGGSNAFRHAEQLRTIALLWGIEGNCSTLMPRMKKFKISLTQLVSQCTILLVH